MAKQKENKQLTRRQLDRHHKEARAERILTIVAISVVAVIVVLAAIGITLEVTQSRTPVARIDDDYIRAKEYQVRQYYQRWTLRMQVLQYEDNIQYLQAQTTTETEAGPQPEGEETTDTSGLESYIQQLQLYAAQLENQLSYDYANILGMQILDMMIEERLILTEAETRGLSVTEDEIDRAIEQELGYDRDAAALAASETTTDTLTVMSAEEYAEMYDSFENQVLNVANFDVEDFREMIRANLLSQLLIDDLSADIASTADQVQLIAFSVETEEDGLALQKRLNSGEELVTDIMEEVNADLENGIAGYELPFLPVNYLEGQFNADIAKIVFNTSTDRATEPLIGPGDTYFVMYVVAHEEQPLSEDIFGSNADQVYQEWLDEQLTNRTEYLDWEKAVITEP